MHDTVTFDEQGSLFMELLRTEGIVVHATPFQEYDRIIKVFTPSDGLLKFIVKGGARSKNGGMATTTPLTVIEIVYTKGRSDLYQCREVSVLNYHLALRNNLSILEASCDMLHVVNSSQVSGKGSKALYQLLETYLNKLSTALDPATISASFRLKILRHEGLLGSFLHCAQCQRELLESYISSGNTFCKEHASPSALKASSSERDIFQLLAFSRDLNLLASLPMTEELSSKIKDLYEELINS